MKQYREYMDGVRVSDTLHRRLAELEAPAKRPVPWVKYGSLAAALALVVGLGTWWLSREEVYHHLMDYDPAAPENEVVAVPDIALVDPGDITVEPGEKTLGGYEVTSGSGSEAMVTHYILPYIEYGQGEGELAGDWDVPAGVTRRQLTQEEIDALMGGADVLDVHLDWGGFGSIYGWGAWYEDGSFWGAYLYGHSPLTTSYENRIDRIEFAVTANQLPPTCVAYPGSVTQEIRGLTVTADGYDIGVGSERRVSFMKDGYGYRFEASSTGDGREERAELWVSRLVRWVADEGLALWTVDPSVTTFTCEVCGKQLPTGTGRLHVHSFIDLVEPNWNDTGADTSAVTRHYACPDCGTQLSVRPHPNGSDLIGVSLIPNEYGAYTCTQCGCTSMEEIVICPDCGETYPAGSAHDCELCTLPLAPTSGVYTCPDCGEIYPMGTGHGHWASTLPPDTHTCPECGETYQSDHHHSCEAPPVHACEVCGQTLTPGVEHSHGVTCPDCGQEYAVGTAHTCRQGGHHQEEHHSDHH